jgi:phosphoenolpyruvate---glycerone phosphotransferase subunit DhaK
MTQLGKIKKLINDPAAAVDEYLESVLLAHADLLAAAGPRAVRRAEVARKGKVGIALGGGSGHEPAFLGYVGPGLADSAAVGNIFAAPSPDAILASIEAANHGAGVILIYGNYSGDVMNCRLASGRAKGMGIAVRSLFATDDIASAPAAERDRRRGIAGEILVFKIAGAAAEAGLSLDEVERIARKANAATGSMGVALSGAELPGAPRPIFESPPDQMEVGLGVHGEPGVRREPLASADVVGRMLAAAIAADLPLRDGDRVAVLVNGLGATTPIEQYLVHRAACAELRGRDVAVHRSFVGEYVTSLQMAGVSVSFSKLDDELTRLLDSPARSLAWRS